MIRQILVVALIAVTHVGHAAEPTDSSLARLATSLDALTRITKTPHRMDDPTAAACAPMPEIDKIGVHNVHVGYMKSAFCNVYVTPEAKAVILAGRGIYPVGSLVVKSKLASKDSDSPVLLYTVMQKMSPGYDPKHGDWEYSVIDGPSRQVVARGRIESCIECHDSHSDTDYITRTYLNQIGG